MSISKRKPGRPPRGTPPRLPAEELDHLLVFGEVVPCADGDGTTVRYPSYRELSERYGCAHSLIAQFAQKHACVRRREQARARIQAQADEKLVELRATAVAMSRDDELRIVDACLARFEQALAEERVHLDSATDLNVLLRLKEFLQGGPDSRAEVHAVLSLATLQARHTAMLRAADDTTPQERGEMDALAGGEDLEDGNVTVQQIPENWPPISNEVKR